MQWPTNLTVFAKLTNELKVNKEELEEQVKIQAKKKMLKRSTPLRTRLMPVLVNFLDIKWFLARNKNFVTLSKHLQNLPNEFYSTEFLEAMLTLYWNDTKNMILVRIFLPQILLIVSAVYYFHHTLKPRDDD